jgi:hypothetical protein
MPSDVRVHMALMGSGESSIAEEDVVPSSANGMLRADAQFSLQTLAPDAYTLRATVLVAGQSVGSVSTTIRTSRPPGGL